MSRARIPRQDRGADPRPLPAKAAPAPEQLLGRLSRGDTDAVLQLQRSVGNHQLARLAQAGAQPLARQPAPPTQRDKPEPIESPWGIEITDPKGLAAYFRWAGTTVLEDLKDAKVDDQLDTRAREWADEVHSWAEFYAASTATTLTDEDRRRAHERIDEGAKLREEIRWVADAPKRAELRRAAAEAEALAEEVRKLAPRMADTARAAFKAGDEDLLASLADITGNVTDIGLGIHELSRKIAETVASTKGIELPAVSKYTGALDKLNKGLATINLALSLTGEKGKTELDEGLRWVGIAAGAFSSLGTIVGLPAHMGLYANLYLVPLTKACIAGVQRIAEYIHEENKSWVELFGEPGNYNVEPGGKPMWQFMVAVMKSAKETDVPKPPEAVVEYLDDHQDAFEAGVGQEAMPTKGWIFKSLDADALRGWIFHRRKQLWAMLYGSMKVPR